MIDKYSECVFSIASRQWNSKYNTIYIWVLDFFFFFLDWISNEARADNRVIQHYPDK